jgi:hypothetical protein
LKTTTLSARAGKAARASSGNQGRAFNGVE